MCKSKEMTEHIVKGIVQLWQQSKQIRDKLMIIGTGFTQGLLIETICEGQIKDQSPIKAGSFQSFIFQ